MRLPLLSDPAFHPSSKTPGGLGQRLRCAAAALALWIGIGGAASAVAAPVPTDPVRELLRLLERQRAAPAACRPGATPPAALRKSPALAQAAALTPRSGGSDALNLALRRAGYAAALSTAIELSGPVDASAALRMLAARHCAALSNPAYADIGIAHAADRWRVVLAEPLLSPALGSSEDASLQVLALVNAARTVDRRCGARRMRAAPPLRWSGVLSEVSLGHSRDMALRDTLAHVGADGSRVRQRVVKRGYVARQVGENVAAGQGSAEQVVADWLASPDHCENLMIPGYTEMGAAYVIDLRSAAVIYWTQVFARPLRPNRSSPTAPIAAAQAS